MTTTAEKIAVMQAFEEGKAIQYKPSMAADVAGNWARSLGPLWNWDRYSYRIKPQPKVIYVNELDTGWRTYTRKDLADEAFYAMRRGCHGPEERQSIPFIELTPELEKLAKEANLI